MAAHRVRSGDGDGAVRSQPRPQHTRRPMPAHVRSPPPYRGNLPSPLGDGWVVRFLPSHGSWGRRPRRLT
eukprot:8548720-Pyramimonas_sp.AAC.1